jgi:hypothetical protein
VHRGWLLAEKVPSAVMSGGSLRDFTIGLRLDGMDKIREFNSILDEENRNVITNNVWP